MSKKSESYGEAMVRLNEILEGIDQSEIPIDELADRVGEAATLLKKCKKILTETEAKVKNVLEGLDQELGNLEATDEEDDND